MSASDDLPSSQIILQPLERDDGGQWQILEAYPDWSSTKEGEGDDFKPYRKIWMQIRGYIVAHNKCEKMFKWLSGKSFMGRWMLEGAEFHRGFVGEYPWGIPFSMNPDGWLGRSGDKKMPAKLNPVCNSLISKFEADAYQTGALNIHVPARMFFDEENLRWDGLSGYKNSDGRLIFFDPSLTKSGDSALLVDRDYLLEFLSRKGLALLWTVLGEKIYIGEGGSSPRLEFSQTHFLERNGIMRSSKLKTKSS